MKETISDPRKLFSDTEKPPQESSSVSADRSHDFGQRLNLVEDEIQRVGYTCRYCSVNEIEGQTLFGENEPLKQAVAHLQTLLPKVTSHLAEKTSYLI